MASTTTKLSPWLNLAKEDISQTPEWKELVSELFEAVQQQLTENHVSYFSDLSEAEKILFLDRAGKLVKSSLRHEKLVATVSTKLDQRLNESVMDELMSPLNEKTKIELVLESACNSCSILLQKWPDMRTKLFTCFNRPLTPKLRKLIWKMFLSNQRLRDKYIKEQWKPNKTQENAIVQRCHAFVGSESWFTSLPKQQLVLIVNAMAKSLVYKQFYYKEPLDDTDYLLIIPFLKVVAEDCFHSDGCHGNVEEMSADLLEMFSTFLDYRPVYMKDSGTKEFNIALKQVGEIMASALESKDYQLAESLKKLLCQDDSLEALSVSLVNLMRSYLRSMFVGYLPLEVVCYIWDQHILSLKLQKLKCIPTFAVVVLLLLKNKIMGCRTPRDVEYGLLEGCKTLKTRQFQNEVDNRFMPEWRNLIDEEVQGFELPLVDPVATLGRAQPSTWLFQDRPVSRQRPEDRRAAREAREMERKRIEQQKRREEIQRQRDEEERRRKEQENLRNTFDQDKKSQAEKIATLEHELEREQQKRSTMLKQMEDQIARLQEELARLNGLQELPVTSLSSTLPSPIHPSPSVVAGPSGDMEVQDLLRDLLRTATGAVNQLTHGTETQEEHLQQVAKTAMNLTKTDYKEAETTLFGRELSNEDWDEMTPDQRQINRELLFKKLEQLRQTKP